MNGFNLLEASDIKLGGSTITALYYGSTKLWPTSSIDYSTEYFTIESLANSNTIKFNKSGSAPTTTIRWSSDKTTWNSVSSSSSGTALKTLNKNEKIYIKGSNIYYASYSSNYNYFSSTGDFNVSGNIMSLLYGDNFIGQTTLPSFDYIFCKIFDSSKVVDASNLILPATTLRAYCYRAMFNFCPHLTTAPELPATTLAEQCYSGMFQGCESLTTAPSILPATTLAEYCYNYMFYGCKSLTSAPELPATTLTDYCYNYMFNNCSSLNYIKMLATDISASDCLTNWVSGVASTGTFVKEYGVDIPINSTSGIPTGWTVQEINNPAEEYLTFKILSDGNIYWRSNDSISKTIEYSLNDGAWTSITSSTTPTTIPVVTNDVVKFRGSNSSYATSNTVYCGFGQGEAGTSGESTYDNDAAEFEASGNIMSLIYGDNFASQTSFNDGTYNFCSLFKKAKVVSTKNLVLPATTLTEYCYRAMFSYCTYLTTTPKLPATTLATYCYASMFSGCTSLTTAPTLSATTMKSNCYGSMFSGCTSLTTAPKLPATTLATYCYASMFSGCTSLTTAPELPATTLATYCYRFMFGNCTSLTTAPKLPATTLATYCYQLMFYGCTSLTKPPTLSATTMKIFCYHSMFEGCTSLTTAPELPATTLANYCYTAMFYGCTKLNYIKCLATTISATDCTLNWVKDVAASGTFTKKSGMTKWETGTSGIPSGWTVKSV